MNIVNKEDVLKLFNELLPWEKVEILDEILNNLGGVGNVADYLFSECGYSPFDFTNIEKCVDHYGADALLDEMSDYDIENFVETHPSWVSAYSLIEALKDKWEYHRGYQISESNIEELEKLLAKIKEEKNEEI